MVPKRFLVVAIKIQLRKQLRVVDTQKIKNHLNPRAMEQKQVMRRKILEVVEQWKMETMVQGMIKRGEEEVEEAEVEEKTERGIEELMKMMMAMEEELLQTYLYLTFLKKSFPIRSSTINLRTNKTKIQSKIVMVKRRNEKLLEIKDRMVERKRPGQKEEGARTMKVIIISMVGQVNRILYLLTE